ncbi:MAG: hypothetical protein H6622_03045 [Halobacteriovoraceae bacterium]|nr:hypothetical protein [Halobacteriovoraceae bacterium]
MKNLTKAIEVCFAICRNAPAKQEDIKWARKELNSGLKSFICSYDLIKLLLIFAVIIFLMKLLV